MVAFGNCTGDINGTGLFFGNVSVIHLFEFLVTMYCNSPVQVSHPETYSGRSANFVLNDRRKNIVAVGIEPRSQRLY